MRTGQCPPPEPPDGQSQHRGWARAPDTRRAGGPGRRGGRTGAHRPLAAAALRAAPPRAGRPVVGGASRSSSASPPASRRQRPVHCLFRPGRTSGSASGDAAPSSPGRPGRWALPVLESEGPRTPLVPARGIRPAGEPAGREAVPRGPPTLRTSAPAACPASSGRRRGTHLPRAAVSGLLRQAWRGPRGCGRTGTSEGDRRPSCVCKSKDLNCPFQWEWWKSWDPQIREPTILPFFHHVTLPSFLWNKVTMN